MLGRCDFVFSFPIVDIVSRPSSLVIVETVFVVCFLFSSSFRRVTATVRTSFHIVSAAIRNSQSKIFRQTAAVTHIRVATVLYTIGWYV